MDYKYGYITQQINYLSSKFVSMKLEMKYFLPEWNDVIFRKYDFLNDVPIDNTRIYSHELIKSIIFDGLLVSKSYLEETKSRLKSMKEKGIHEFLRYPGEIIGDCGAWSYSKAKNPPYSVDEILSFYQELGVNIGVSLDHLCNTKDENENERRRLLTVTNAEEFYNKSLDKSFSFEPLGVVQGYDISSYEESLEEILEIGYCYIGIGGLAGAKTNKILPILKKLSPIIKKQQSKPKIHLFGVARLTLIRDFHKYGIHSFDSASPLRHAWLGPGKNYKDQYYNGYAAFRLPFVDRAGSKYIKELKDSGKFSIEELKKWEQNLHKLLLDFDEGKTMIQTVISEFSKFDELLGPNSKNLSKMYIQTLNDKPWKDCECELCLKLGIEIMIFRGNERNKLRGFHNVYRFYYLLQKILNDPNFNFQNHREMSKQTALSMIEIVPSRNNQEVQYKLSG